MGGHADPADDRSAVDLPVPTPPGEIEAGRWVLLEPPNQVPVFWWRALAAVLLVLTPVLVLDVPGVAGPRSGGQWTLLALAALAVVIGSVWLCAAAGAPRPVTSAIARLEPARPGRRERRRLARALRSSEPLAPADRPAATAYTARRHDDLWNPGAQLAGTGFAVALGADTASGIGAWVLLAFLGFLSLGTLVAAHRARALLRAAARAGVAPLVSDTPSALRGIGPTAPTKKS